MVDLDDNRLDVAKTFGATEIIHSSKENALEKIMSLTGKKGVDVAIEAVEVAATFELYESIIAPGGHIANVGVHGKSVSLHLETFKIAI
jgi:alcohol dehydrogenase